MTSTIPNTVTTLTPRTVTTTCVAVAERRDRYDSPYRDHYVFVMICHGNITGTVRVTPPTPHPGTPTQTPQDNPPRDPLKQGCESRPSPLPSPWHSNRQAKSLSINAVQQRRQNM